MHQLTPKFEQPNAAPEGESEVERLTSTSLVSEMLRVETLQLNKLLPSTYYPTAVQIGGADFDCDIDSLKSLSCGVQIYLFDDVTKTDESRNTVLVDYAVAPLPARSVDLAVLPHLLERVEDPIPVLREISQTISANGIIAITGFNPMSFYGVKSVLSKSLHRYRKPYAYRSRTRCLHRMGQIQDWLSLLNFELRAASVFYYKPPFAQNRLRARFECLEKAGARWWPAGGSVYVLVARKREVGARLLPVKKHKAIDLKRHAAKPLARYKRSVSRLTDDAPKS